MIREGNIKIKERERERETEGKDEGKEQIINNIHP